MDIEEKKNEIKGLNLILNQFFDFIYEISEVSVTLDKKSRKVIKGLKKLSSFLNKNLQDLQKKKKNFKIPIEKKDKKTKKINEKKNEKKIVQSEIYIGKTDYEKEIENIFMTRVQEKILEINNLKIQNFKIKKELQILKEEKIHNSNNFFINENLNSKNKIKNSEENQNDDFKSYLKNENFVKNNKSQNYSKNEISEDYLKKEIYQNYFKNENSQNYLKNENSQNIFLKGNLKNKKLFVSKNYESKLSSERDNLLNVLSISKYSKNDFKEFTLGKKNNFTKYDNIDFVKIIFLQCKTLEEGI